MAPSLELPPGIAGVIAIPGLMAQHLLPPTLPIPFPCWRETGQDKQIWAIAVALRTSVAPGAGSTTVSPRGTLRVQALGLQESPLAMVKSATYL